MASKSEDVLANMMRFALKGDKGQYHLFLKEITPILRNIIFAKAGGLDKQEQEDILQDVLMAVHQKKHTWRQDQPIKPWLYAITRYKIIDAFRKRGKTEFVDIDDAGDMMAQPADQHEYEMQKDVTILVAQLKGKQGEVVRAIGIEGKSINVVAKDMNMKETAIRVNFHRGLEKLRKLAKG